MHACKYHSKKIKPKFLKTEELLTWGRQQFLQKIHISQNFSQTLQVTQSKFFAIL